MQSNKLNKLPPYLFAGIDKKKRELREKGADVIDMSVGDPDIPTPEHIIERLGSAAADPKNHKYPPYNGTRELREAAAKYLFDRNDKIKVKVDPDTEVLALIGSKEGIAHMPAAFLNEGDVSLIPSPGYPVYNTSAILAGVTPYEMPLKRENDFLPDLKAIPKDILKRSKLLFLNYPNNPTSAVATIDFFKEAVEFARQNKLLICHDAAYIDITFDGYKAPSILEVDGAKDVALEFHSLSKTYNMTGWRLGFVAGNAEAIATLGKFKAMIDSSATAFVQEAGAFALSGSQECVKKTVAIFQRRRDKLVAALTSAGWDLCPCKATFYIWAKTPKGVGSSEFAAQVLEKAHVAITPGVGFGRFGEGYVRFSTTSPDDRIEEAVRRIVGLKL